MISPFGVDHGGEVSKAAGASAETKGFKRDKQLSTSEKTAIGVGGTGAAGTGVAFGTKMPEHSHYDKKTRKYLSTLEPGVTHEVDTKMLAKRPRKLGARKQQSQYVAAMAKERPAPYSPVPITRYKGGHAIQRDNAHSVMANAMKGEKTLIRVEDAPGHRPTRRTGEELVRRGQMRYQERRLKRNFNLGDKKIDRLVGEYKPESRRANTSKRPHGVTEDTFRYSKKPYKAKSVIRAGKNITAIAKRERDRDVAAGATGAAGAGVLATTPVRRSASKVNIQGHPAGVSGEFISSKDAKKIASPGYRPGNKKAIKTMAANLGHLEKQPTKLIRYKDGTVIPFDGNHRMTARVARGDKRVPVQVIEGKDRPAVSVTRNAYHAGQQRLHRRRMKQGAFTPNTKAGSKGYTGKHAGESKTYRKVANASPSRSGRRVDIGSTRAGSGPTKAMLRTRQGATVATGTALLGTAGYLRGKKEPR